MAVEGDIRPRLPAVAMAAALAAPDRPEGTVADTRQAAATMVATTAATAAATTAITARITTARTSTTGSTLPCTTGSGGTRLTGASPTAIRGATRPPTAIRMDRIRIRRMPTAPGRVRGSR